MNSKIASEIDISAILSTYVYMDEQSSNYIGKDLSWILDNMPKEVKETTDYKVVLDAVNKNKELGEMTLVSQSMTSGYSSDLIIACAFKSSNGDIYVSYRGTGDGKWVDNGIGIANESTEMQEEANSYFDKLVETLKLENYDGQLIVTGHSKGGNEAQYVTLNSQYAHLIDKCYSIDGQGFSEEAIERFKKLFGLDYEKQLKKMYSINGENDYVHDLGITVIPEENTYIIPTEDAKSFGDYHDIKHMIRDGKINWKYENGEIVSAEQGPIGEFAKELSKKMRYLDQEDLEDCAVTIMSLLEFYLPYGGKMGGEELYGTGERSFMTTEEAIGFLAYGLPLLFQTMLFTEEGRAMISELIKDAVIDIHEKYGVVGLIGAAFVGAIALTATTLAIGVISGVAFFIEKITDIIEQVAEFTKKVKRFFISVKEAFIETINKYLASIKNRLGIAVEQLSSQIRLNTNLLTAYAQRLNSVNSRIARLDRRLDGLYWKVGLQGLWNLIQADALTGYSWRLNRCSNYLSTTATSFEKVEKKLVP